ncbi:hypothetical protein CANTEDRAFT_133479 [Yamadazyma tenuis ATCC 10573]|uniref:Uncharacterized protein n=1 Tax=Candida tenuis (strain ATCC 10573 / BCRC 21748 / CBS 615 / JCM 9827 / NBRC 10315 / NRRL Y-1498 / VKM Y-70) TaxID=590646 RepID=G3AZA9_CANTC|nr:uncharacterized protein CANTEDRAFT_133479 [Yamadazyma tenuis ATCC 10573]EGV66051.1 hypothetical protein CANTEDRAFT_133479 [Yamadazyma tenuis ATCC 10573]
MSPFDPSSSQIKREAESTFTTSENHHYPEYRPSRTTGYVAVGIAILPTFLAVLVPVFPNSPSSNDIAILITDTLIVVLVTWAVWFLGEWPWKWLEQVKQTKQRLLNRINSQLLIQKSADNRSSNREFEEGVYFLKKLIGTEKKVLSFCFTGILAGGILMVYTRVFIIVEDSRRTIVFSNLNVCIYVSWGTFRLAVFLLETTRRNSLEAAKKDDYNLINESHLHSYMNTNKGVLDRMAEMFIDKAPIPELHRLQQELKENELKQEREWRHLKKAVSSLNQEMLSIRKSPQRISTFHPFPLNFQNRDRAIGQNTDHSSVQTRLSTIFDRNFPSKKHKRVGENLRHFSGIKSLETRLKERNILNDYSSEVNSGTAIPEPEPVNVGMSPGMTSIKSFISLASRIRHKYNLFDVCRHPYMMRHILMEEIPPFLKSFEVFDKIMLTKHILLELTIIHIKSNIETFRRYLQAIGNKCKISMKIAFIQIISAPFKSPYKVLRTSLKIVSFVPKKLIRELFIHPFRIIRPKKSPSLSPIAMSNDLQDFLKPSKLSPMSEMEEKLESPIKLEGLREFTINRRHLHQRKRKPRSPIQRFH